MDKAIGKAAKKGAELIEKRGGKMKLKLQVKPNKSAPPPPAAFPPVRKPPGGPGFGATAPMQPDYDNDQQ